MIRLLPSIEELTFVGDKKKAQELLALIQLPIADAEAYEVAYSQFIDARNFVDTLLLVKRSLQH